MRWLWMAALVLLAPQPARAVEYAGPQVETYDVAGDAAAVLRGMLSALPAAEGEHFATTTWVLHYDLETRPQPPGCAVASARVTLSVTTRIPRLVEANSSPDVVQRWGRFVAALRQHEQGHQRIAEEAAQRLEDGLRGLPPVGAPCPVLDAQAKGLFASLSEDLQWRQEDYDRQTGFGRDQGAVFP